jgi:hypothetical protein
MGGKRSVWGRLGAWLDFEVSAESLEAYRRASVLVDELQGQARERRLACVMDGLDPWALPPGTRAGFLCAWNATVLQTLGDALLDADAADTPRTAGFVPRPMHDEVATYYDGVEAWLDRARQAFANPEYRLDRPVPDRLPVPAADPFPVLGLRDSRARGLLAGLRAVREHAAAAMTLLPETVADPARQAQLRSIRQRYEWALAAAREAETPPPARGAVPDEEHWMGHVRGAIERFYELGQLIAAPGLVDGESVNAVSPRTVPPDAPPAPREEPDAASPAAGVPSSGPATPPPAPRPVKDGSRQTAGSGKAAPNPSHAHTPDASRLPGGANFDVWCLTHPAARKAGKATATALKCMWDAAPRRVLRFHDEIQEALRRGDVAHATDGRRGAMYWPCRPWAPVYVARRTISLDGRRIPAKRRFVLETGSTDFLIGCRLIKPGS